MSLLYATVKKSLLVLVAAAAVALASCSRGPKPTPTPPPPVPVGEATFADGRGLRLGFKLLYALDETGGNNVLGTAGLMRVLAAAKFGASGETAGALARELGMQGMQPRQINEVALRMGQGASKLTNGRYASAWCMIFGAQQYVNESYLSETRQSLQLDCRFPVKPLDAVSGNEYLSEWADESTLGIVKQVEFAIPGEPAPFFVDIFTADPDWELALDTGKSRPMPFLYESGEQYAVPTMICYQQCGIYESPEGSLAVLPAAGDETRLVILVPPEGLSLHDFIPVAAAKYDEWLDKAEWAKQRVLLPRFKLTYNSSVMPVLERAGIGPLLGQSQDYSALGRGLYVSDVLQKASLTVDESGAGAPDPEAVWRPGVKDGIATFAAGRPFLVVLERTDPGTGLGRALLMGFVRDPLKAATK